MKNIVLLFVFLGAMIVYGQDTIVSKSQQSNKALGGIPAVTGKNLPCFVEQKRDGFHLDNGTVMRMPEFAKLLNNEGLGHLWDQYSSGLKSLNTGHGLLLSLIHI